MKAKTVYNGYKLTRVKKGKQPTPRFRGTLTRNGFKVCAFEYDTENFVLEAEDPEALKDCNDLTRTLTAEDGAAGVADTVKEYVLGHAGERNAYAAGLILALMAEDGCFN